MLDQMLGNVGPASQTLGQHFLPNVSSCADKTANPSRLHNVGLMLAHRLRRLTNNVSVSRLLICWHYTCNGIHHDLTDLNYLLYSCILTRVVEGNWSIVRIRLYKKKMNECRYKLNWARRTFWGWWDEWDDTALQTQDLKFEPWRSEVEHAASRSQRFPTILNHYEWAGKRHFVSLKLEGQSGVRNRDLRLSKQAALTTAPGPRPVFIRQTCKQETLNQCLFEVGPSSGTLTQPQAIIGSTLDLNVAYIFCNSVSLRKSKCCSTKIWLVDEKFCCVIENYFGSIPHVAQMLGHRLQRWAKIRTASVAPTQHTGHKSNVG